MKQRAIRVLRRRKWGSIALFAILNRRSRRLVGSGAGFDATGQSREGSVEEAVAYVESSFQTLLDQGGLTRADIEERRILELGPGDNLGLALRFVAAGAGQVVAVDRFEVQRDLALELAIYRGVLEGLEPGERARAEAAARFGERAEFDPQRLRTVYGTGIEEAAEALERESFDLILSVAVLEHVYNPDDSFVAMDRLLKPGGIMLHQVDFRDHAMFTGGGQHPLTFLTISPRVWKAITYDWGGPNRRLIDYYRAQVQRLQYDARLLVNHVLGNPEPVPPRDALAAKVEVSSRQRELIDALRPRLQPPFRELPDEDLVPDSVFVVARKPLSKASAA